MNKPVLASLFAISIGSLYTISIFGYSTQAQAQMSPLSGPITGPVTSPVTPTPTSNPLPTPTSTPTPTIVKPSPVIPTPTRKQVLRTVGGHVYTLTKKGYVGVKGVTVQVSSTKSNRTYQTTTDAQGGYIIQFLNPEAVSVKVITPKATFTPSKVTIPAGESAKVNFYRVK